MYEREHEGNDWKDEHKQSRLEVRYDNRQKIERNYA